MDQLDLINQIELIDALDNLETSDAEYEYTPSVSLSDVIHKLDTIKHNLKVANKKGVLNADKNKAIKDILNTIDKFIRQDKKQDIKYIIIRAIHDYL